MTTDLIVSCAIEELKAGRLDRGRWMLDRALACQAEEQELLELFGALDADDRRGLMRYGETLRRAARG